jgi:hypothetical protein
MKDITRKLKSSWATGTTNDDELVDIKTELYPREILYAAQATLGADKITAYYAEMYEFGIECMKEGLQIKKAQMTGIKLTHQKLKGFLSKQGIEDVANMDNVELTKIYLKHHLAQMEESVKIFRSIAAALGD